MGNIFRNERKVPVSINFFHVQHAKEIKENRADAKRKQFRSCCGGKITQMFMMILVSVLI